MDARISIVSGVACALVAACSGTQQGPDPVYAHVAVIPDRAVSPASVRFEVPTALVMSLPGGHVPNTLEARLSTRAIAERELAAAGYCPKGFTGPDGVFFPGGDRSRTAFVVRCFE
jgi:hypothetical protein